MPNLFLRIRENVGSYLYTVCIFPVPGTVVVVASSIFFSLLTSILDWLWPNIFSRSVFLVGRPFSEGLGRVAACTLWGRLGGKKRPPSSFACRLSRLLVAKDPNQANYRNFRAASSLQMARQFIAFNCLFSESFSLCFHRFFVHTFAALITTEFTSQSTGPNNGVCFMINAHLYLGHLLVNISFVCLLSAVASRIHICPRFNWLIYGN